jgi:hypothetical protein
MHPKAAIQSFIGTEIEAPVVINFLGYQDTDTNTDMDTDMLDF